VSIRVDWANAVDDEVVSRYDWIDWRGSSDSVVASGSTVFTADTLVVSRPLAGVETHGFQIRATDIAEVTGDWSEAANWFLAVGGSKGSSGDTIFVPPDSTPKPPAVDTTQAVAITDMGDSVTYHGFEGGLYQGAENTIPPVHAAVQPPVDGTRKYVLLSISMSNGSQEFCSPLGGDVGLHRCTSFSFVGQADTLQSIADSLVIVNGAQSGQAATAWDDPSDQAYDIANQSLGLFGLGPEDVQIIWLKQANPGPTISLPSPNADAFDLLRNLGNVTRAIRVRYPNTRQVYVSSRIWSCVQGGLNGEPFAYESGYAVKWLVEAQINQLATGDVDPRAGDLGVDVAPWLAWGPYLWADDGNPNSAGLTWSPADLDSDCTHPSASGVKKVGRLLLEFFSTSALTSRWFMN
jgi:hypothetical protein